MIDMKRLRSDEGRITLFIAVFAFAALMLTGVIVDGGGRVRALQTADNIASQAARSAGQAIDIPLAMAGGDKKLDVKRAEQVGNDYIRAAGASGSIKVLSDQVVQADVTVDYQPRMLGMFGFGPMTVHGSATAQLIPGN